MQLIDQGGKLFVDNIYKTVKGVWVLPSISSIYVYLWDKAC